MARPFPDALDAVPLDRRLTETFGWQPANFGALILLLSLFIAATDKTLSFGGWAFLAVFAGGGLALLAWELRRRRRPRAAVLQDGQVALYKDGRLARVLRREDLVFCMIEETNTFKIVFGLGIVGAALGLLAVVRPNPGVTGFTLAERLGLFSASAAFFSACVSSVYSRHRCTSLIFPAEKGLNDVLAFTRADGAKLLSASGALFSRSD